MKTINISNNIIDTKKMSRLMKLEDGDSSTLYIVQSKADCMNDFQYTVLTPVDENESFSPSFSVSDEKDPIISENK